jgi:hypothetical protein
VALSLSCSSGSSPGSNPPDGGGGGQDAGVDSAPIAPVDASAIDAYAGPTTEHGTLVDYQTQMPIPGLTVTDNGVSSVTDDAGTFSMMIPSGATFAPTVMGPGYTQLLFPQSVPAAADVDYATNVMASASAFMLEQSGLSNDTTKALVQVVVLLAPSCASAVGGTLNVLAPAGTTTVYFSATSLPDTSLTSFQAVSGERPVAVIFNVAVGADLSVQMNHPTCKQVPFPYTYKGKTLTGKLATHAAEPGDYNSALVLMLE